MAVQIDSPGQLQDLLEILSRRRWQVLLPLLTILTLGSAFAVLVPKKYEVTTEVELRETLVSEGGRASESMATRDVANAPLQIKSMKRIRATVEALGWEDFSSLGTGAEQNEYLKDLRDDLDVNLPKKASNTGSTFVTLSFLHIDKQRALDFLLDLRQLWIEEVVEIDRLAIDSKYETLLDQQRKGELELQKEREALQQLRATHNISPTQPATRSGQTREEDRIFEQLESQQDQQVALELEIADDEDQLELIQDRLLATPLTIPRETTIEGQSFEDQINKWANQRVQLEVGLKRYKPAHSKYSQILRKIKEIDDTVALLEANRTEGKVETDFETNPDYLELEEQLAEHSRLLEQKRRRLATTVERISELEGQMIERQQVYSEIDERSARLASLELAQTELALDLQKTKVRREEIKGPAGNPFQVTEEAELPLKPTEPNPWLIVAFSLIAGVAVGFGTAVLLEFSKSAFRNPGDISRTMVVPVLGVVNRIVTRTQERRRLIRKSAVAGVMVGVLGAVVLITYAWQMEPDRLPSGLMDAIEDFRKIFR